MYNRQSSNKLIGLLLEFEQWSGNDLNVVTESDMSSFKYILSDKYGVFVNEQGYVMEADAVKLNTGIFSAMKQGLKNSISGAFSFGRNILRSCWKFFKSHWKLMTATVLAFGVAGFSIFSIAAHWKKVSGDAKSLADQAKLWKNRSKNKNELLNGASFSKKVKTLFDKMVKTYDSGYELASKIVKKNWNANADKGKLKRAVSALSSAGKDMAQIMKEQIKSLTRYAVNLDEHVNVMSRMDTISNQKNTIAQYRKAEAELKSVQDNLKYIYSEGSKYGYKFDKETNRIVRTTPSSPSYTIAPTDYKHSIKESGKITKDIIERKVEDGFEVAIDTIEPIMKKGNIAVKRALTNLKKKMNNTGEQKKKNNGEKKQQKELPNINQGVSTNEFVK